MPTPPEPPEPPDVDLQALEGLENLRVFGVPGMRPRLGITVDTVGKQLADYFGVKQGGGALVTSVGKGSAAETVGLKAGDVIVKVDDEAVQDAGDLHTAMRDRRGKALTLTVVRDRRETTIKVPEPPERETPPPGVRSRPAVDHGEIQRQIERAMRDGEQARRLAMATQRAAYAEAMRAVHEAMERQYGTDTETPEAIEIDDEAIQDAIEDAHDEIEDAVDEGIEQGLEGGADIQEIGTPTPDDEEGTVDAEDATEEQRAEIRRAVEEARRIRIQTQQEDDR